MSVRNFSRTPKVSEGIVTSTLRTWNSAEPSSESNSASDIGISERVAVATGASGVSVARSILLFLLPVVRSRVHVKCDTQRSRVRFRSFQSTLFAVNTPASGAARVSQVQVHAPRRSFLGLECFAAGLHILHSKP